MLLGAPLARRGHPAFDAQGAAKQGRVVAPESQAGVLKVERDGLSERCKLEPLPVTPE